MLTAAIPKSNCLMIGFGIVRTRIRVAVGVLFKIRVIVSFKAIINDTIITIGLGRKFIFALVRVTVRDGIGVRLGL